jgi:hypothetical protein
VLVENAGFGGTHAAPIAQKVIQAYLESFKGENKNIKIDIAELKNH